MCTAVSVMVCCKLGKRQEKVMYDAVKLLLVTRRESRM